MMGFLRKPGSGMTARAGLLEDLEAIGRKAKVVLFFAPALILFGFGTGHVTGRVLALPEDAPIRTTKVVDVPTAQLETLGRHMVRLREHGSRTADYVQVYREHVAPVERVLQRRGLAAPLARQVAWPLVEQTYRNRLDVATVISVMLIESNGRPEATSPVGARGLMQVMPFWAGRWRVCGRDLYDIEGNLCHGTNILAWYLARHGGDERRALLGYNGCVIGSTTPNCHTYPEKVDRIRRQISAELAAARNAPRPGAAASR
jgi:hypothetical protein